MLWANCKSNNRTPPLGPPSFSIIRHVNTEATQKFFQHLTQCLYISQIILTAALTQTAIKSVKPIRFNWFFFLFFLNFSIQRLWLCPQSSGSPERRQDQSEDRWSGKCMLGGENPFSRSSLPLVYFPVRPIRWLLSLFPSYVSFPAQTLHRGHSDQTVQSSGGSDWSRVRTPGWHLEHCLHGTRTHWCKTHTHALHAGFSPVWLLQHIHQTIVVCSQ